MRHRDLAPSGLAGAATWRRHGGDVAQKRKKKKKNLGSSGFDAMSL